MAAFINKSLFRFTALAVTFGVYFGFTGIGSAKDSTWGKISVSTQRFQLLSNYQNEAVLDRETGLVWQQCPSNITVPWMTNDAFTGYAVGNCYSAQTGGRTGWRLPTYEELQSLGDPSRTPFLPNNAPFCSTTHTDPNGELYWTSTTFLNLENGTGANGDAVYIVNSRTPAGAYYPKRPATGGIGAARAWCVRTGSGPVMQYNTVP